MTPSPPFSQVWFARAPDFHIGTQMDFIVEHVGQTIAVLHQKDSPTAPPTLVMPRKKCPKDTKVGHRVRINLEWVDSGEDRTRGRASA